MTAATGHAYHDAFDGRKTRGTSPMGSARARRPRPGSMDTLSGLWSSLQMLSAFRWAALLPAILGGVFACSDGALGNGGKGGGETGSVWTGGGGGVTTGSGGNGSACVPGAQAACACNAGKWGFQICAANGSGYGACQGCDAAGGSGGVASGGGGNGGSGEATGTTSSTTTTSTGAGGSYIPCQGGPTEIDLHLATLYDNPPGLADWPVTTALTEVDFTNDGVHLEFSKKDGPDRWPDIIPPGWGGPLQYTLGMAECIAGQWHASAAVEFWYGLEASGGNIALDDQVAKNWYYDAGRWGALAGRQPATGETIGIFVVAGNARAVHADDPLQSPVMERSNVVLVPMPDVGGANHVF